MRLCPYTTLGLCVYLQVNTLVQTQTSKERRRRKKAPPVSLKSARKEDGGSAIYSRDVTVGVSSSSGFTPLLRRAVKRWQEMFVFMYLTPTGVMEYMGV